MALPRELTEGWRNCWATCLDRRVVRMPPGDTEPRLETQGRGPEGDDSRTDLRR